MAPSHKTGGKSAASRLTLTVVVELLNAAPAASTVRVILPSVLFLRATRFYFNIYNAEALESPCFLLSFHTFRIRIYIIENFWSSRHEKK